MDDTTKETNVILNGRTKEELVQWFCKISNVRRLLAKESPLFSAAESRPNQLQGVITFNNVFLIYEDYGLPCEILTPLGSWKISRGGVTDGVTTEKLLKRLGIKYERIFSSYIQIIEDHLGNKYESVLNDDIILEDMDVKKMFLGGIPISVNRVCKDFYSEIINGIENDYPDAFSANLEKIKTDIILTTTCEVDASGVIKPTFTTNGLNFTGGSLKYFQKYAGKNVEVTIRIKDVYV